MERCPACNAKYNAKSICHRCGSDLSPLLDIERRAAGHLNNAVSAYHAMDFRKMLFHAERACYLQTSRDSLKILACASLLSRQFDRSLKLWNKITGKI